MRTDDGADAIDRILIFFCVSGKGRVHGLLKRLQAVGDLDDVRAQNLHTSDVGCLLFDIDRAHVNVAFHAEIRGGRGHSDAVLARARLGDQLLLAHVLGQKTLAHAVVELMGAGVVQILALYVDLGTTHPSAVVHTAGGLFLFAVCT